MFSNIIVNVRGTSGSGKTTVSREIMHSYPQRTQFREPGRKAPIFYGLETRDADRTLDLIGGYETQCGGCDSIHTLDEVFHLVENSYRLDHDVFFGEFRLCSG